MSILGERFFKLSNALFCYHLTPIQFTAASGARTLASKWAESIVRSFIEGLKGTAGLPSVPFHIEDAIQDGLPV